MKISKRDKITWAVIAFLLLLSAVVAIEWPLYEDNINDSEFAEGYVSPIEGYTPFQMSMLYFGEKEVTGAASNSTILSFFDGLADWVSDDETPWCSAFMNYVHAKSGYKFTGSLAARSWLDYGYKTNSPVPGDIVVLWRGTKEGWQGHVGFFSRFNSDRTKVLVYGGNQYNQITFSWYPTYRVLGYRISEPDFNANTDASGFIKLDMGVN